MPPSYHDNELTLGTSAIYRIEVQGWLDVSWSDRLSGMKITARNQEDQAPVTTLTGRVRDRAELIGILNNLYQLHTPILMVEILSVE